MLSSFASLNRPFHLNFNSIFLHTEYQSGSGLCPFCGGGGGGESRREVKRIFSCLRFIFNLIKIKQLEFSRVFKLFLSSRLSLASSSVLVCASTKKWLTRTNSSAQLKKKVCSLHEIFPFTALAKAVFTLNRRASLFRFPRQHPNTRKQQLWMTFQWSFSLPSCVWGFTNFLLALSVESISDFCVSLSRRKTSAFRHVAAPNEYWKTITEYYVGTWHE